MEHRVAAWLKISIIVLLSIFAIAAKASITSSDTIQYKSKNDCDTIKATYYYR